MGNNRTNLKTINMKIRLKLIIVLISLNVGAQITNKPSKFENGINPTKIFIGATIPNSFNSTIFQSQLENSTFGGNLANSFKSIERTKNPTGTGYYFGSHYTITRSGIDNETGTKGMFLDTRKTGDFNSLVLYGIDNEVHLTGGGTTSFAIGQASDVNILGSKVQDINYLRGYSGTVTMNNKNAKSNHTQGSHVTVNLQAGTINGSTEAIYLDFDVSNSSDLNVLGDVTYLRGGGGSDIENLVLPEGKKKRFIWNQGPLDSDFTGLVNYNGGLSTYGAATNKALVNIEYLNSLNYTNGITTGNTDHQLISNGTEVVKNNTRQISAYQEELVFEYIASQDAVALKLADPIKNIINSKVGGSGTTNFLSKFTASGTLGNSQIFDNGTSVGIGTTLHVKTPNNTTGTIIVQGGMNPVTSVNQINSELNFGSNDQSATGGIGGSIKSVTEYSNGAWVGMAFYTTKQGRSPVLKEAMRIDNNGNVGIGTSRPNSNLEVSDGNGGSQASFNIGSNFGTDTWLNTYLVRASTILPLTYLNNGNLPKGGAYRFTGHIERTGTDQSTRAVFWNENNTWYVNVTGQSGVGGNHVEFLVHNGVPSVRIAHPSYYNVRVLHERIKLLEGSGTDNTRHYFGADAYMSQIGENILMNYGNVGIGTNNPSEKLEVNGNIKAKDTIEAIDGVILTDTAVPENRYKITVVNGILTTTLIP